MQGDHVATLLPQIGEELEKIEVIGPELSAGSADLEWTVNDPAQIFDGLGDGSVLESDFMLKVDNPLGTGNDENSVSQQNISVNFQSNSKPFLQDGDKLPLNLSTEGTEDQNLIYLR